MPDFLHARSGRLGRRGRGRIVSVRRQGMTTMYEIKPFDSLHVGDRVSVSKTITEADGALYIAATGDFGPVHIDDGYASTTRFGRRLAPGIMVAGLCTSVLTSELVGDARRFDRRSVLVHRSGLLRRHDHDRCVDFRSAAGEPHARLGGERAQRRRSRSSQGECDAEVPAPEIVTGKSDASSRSDKENSPRPCVASWSPPCCRSPRTARSTGRAMAGSSITAPNPTASAQSL